VRSKKESSTIAPTLGIVSNTYMEGVPRQRQTVSPRRQIYDSIWLEFTGESYIQRTVGKGYRMGNTCTPMVDSCQCTAKSYNIVISLQLK